MGNKSSKNKSKIKGQGYSLKDDGPSAERPKGNKNFNKSPTGGRGQPLGSQAGPQSRTAAQARAIDRFQSNLKPGKKPKGDLQRKERILAVMDDADRIKTSKATEYYDELSDRTFKSRTAMNEYRYKHFGIPIPSSSTSPEREYAPLQPRECDANCEEFKFNEVEPNTNVGKAAINRIQIGQKKKKNRFAKTADDLLTEAANEDSIEEKTSPRTSPNSGVKKKSVNDWYVAAGGARSQSTIGM